MADYGDERGFRSRGVPADIGFDRAGPGRGVGPRSMPYSAPPGPHARVGPPSNIGSDRDPGFFGGQYFNDFRQTMGDDYGSKLSDYLNRGNQISPRFKNPVWPWRNRFNRDTTTVPEGVKDPDWLGRMRPEGADNPYAAPIDNNPMGGANLGGGWNMYEGGPEPQRLWEYMRNATPMGGNMQTAYNVGDTYPLGQIDNYGRRLPNSPDPVYNDLKTVPLDMQFDQCGNPIGSDDYGYFDDTFAARGGLMSLRR